MTRKNGFVINSIAIFGYMFIYAPIFFVALYSFNKSQSIEWKGVSLKWYRELFQNEAFLAAAITSIKVAFASATISVVVGTMCAYAWAHIKPPRHILGKIAIAPLVIPDIVMGLSLSLSFIWFLQTFGWPQKGMVTLIISHTILGISYVTSIVRTRIISIDQILEETAMDLGARPSSIFFLITLPIILPSLISGWLIAFVLSLDDLIFASFTAGPGSSTLPLMIFSRIKLGITPQINVIAVCMILLASCFIIGAKYTMRSFFKKK